MRTIRRLTALQVSRAKEAGLYADGGGLYLQVTHSGARSWIFRFRMNGRKTPRDMGLGSLSTICLADARERAAKARLDIVNQKDPIEEKRSRLNSVIENAESRKTFKECAESYIRGHEAGWRNKKHSSQWKATLERYAYPTIGSLPIQTIDTNHIHTVLDPIWTVKTETASRVRGRIEAVLSWASARGYRKGENPARWRGHLEKLFPQRSKVRTITHHPALPYVELPAFMNELHFQPGLASRALALVILTASRTGEVIRSSKDEFNVETKTWIVPANRMKGGRDHRIPLSDVALRIVKQQIADTSSPKYLFPGLKPDRPLSDMSLLALLKRMDRETLTVHGFRSTFRDWTAEQTTFPREVAEMALAHAIDDKTEAAYRRGDLFAKRVQLMDEWAAYCYLAGTSEGPVKP